MREMKTFKRKKNRMTGTFISVWFEGDYWNANCDDHNQCCEFDSLKQALYFSASPIDWCSDCGIVWAEKNELSVREGL